MNKEGSNCTFMELKYFKDIDCYDEFWSSNCTFMELKSR